MKKLTTEEFIQKSKDKFGDKFEYTNTDYKQATIKVLIGCKIHGDFLIKSSNHFNSNGGGCPKCSTRKKTTEDFIKDAKLAHGDKYDYSTVNYQGATKKVTIICPVHGEFKQNPSSHTTQKVGCPKCGLSQDTFKTNDRGDFVKQRQLDFIQKANEFHDNKFDYSLVQYTNADSKIKIICPEHGEFEQIAKSHLKYKNSCPSCKKKHLEFKNWVKKANEVHNNFYSYKEKDLSHTKDNINVICPIHGEFTQKLNNHIINKNGCPKCGLKKNRKPLGFLNFVKRANEQHDNKYEYIDINNRGENFSYTSRFVVICPIHGEFKTTVGNHSQKGCGCPHCKTEGARLSKEEVLRRFEELHGERYDYSLFEKYERRNQIIPIICNKHGVFEQVINHHMSGSNCPICACHQATSKPQQEIADYVQSLLPNLEVNQNVQGIINGRHHLDIHVPVKDFAIEYHGLYWHTEGSGEKSKNYHLDKTKAASEANLRLLHIFSNEWEQKSEIVKSIISNRLGKSTNVIYGRKTQIKEVSSKDSSKFLEENHIQGKANGSIRYGLYYNEELVSLMTFGKTRFDKKHQYELVRFTNKLHHNVIGGVSKLFKHFLKEYKPDSIVSYSDIRYFEGIMYEKLGFEFSHQSTPNYFYIKDFNNPILESRNKYQKHKLKKTLDEFDPELSEWKNMQINGYDRIWDCGNKVWSWKLE